MPSKLKWELLGPDGQPVRLGCRWLRTKPCPHYRRLDQYIGGPGTLSLALARGGTLFYVDLADWRPGFSQTGIDAESFGAPFRPRRRLVNRKAFKAAVKQARQHWREWLTNFGVSLPPLYRNPFQRIADRCFGPRLSTGQVILASEREIKFPLGGKPGYARWFREAAVISDIPNQLDHSMLGPGRELVAHSIIDEAYAARMGMTGCWVHRAFFLDWAIGDDSYVEGFSWPPAQSDRQGNIVSIQTVTAGHASLSYARPMGKLQKPGDWERDNRDRKRQEFTPRQGKPPILGNTNNTRQQ